MSCQPNCDTVQILEPNGDLIVDTAGTRSDMDERGQAALSPGQTVVQVLFQVPKISADYHFEYLYIDAINQFVGPGAIQIIPTLRSRDGFAVELAGTPTGAGYVLYWRVVVVRTITPDLVDAPEDQYLRLPVHGGLFIVTFANPRSSTSYGFSELRVENLTDPPHSQSPIQPQVYVKNTINFGVALSPPPPTNNYFLRVRTP